MAKKDSEVPKDKRRKKYGRPMLVRHGSLKDVAERVTGSTKEP